MLAVSMFSDAVRGTVHAESGGPRQSVACHWTLLHIGQELRPSRRSVCLLHPVVGGDRVRRAVSC